MSPILGIIASQNYSRIVTTGFVSIATVTLGSNASSITFNSIPSVYKHLQIRGISKDTRTGTGAQSLIFQLNSDTGANYAQHGLSGDGSSASSFGSASASNGRIGEEPTSDSASQLFGASIIDILDYQNTNKYKTIRALNGNDRNGSGTIYLSSSLWMNTAAVTSIKIYTTNSENLVTNSTFALYGIQG